MTVAIQETLGVKFIEIDLKDKLSKDDFKSFVPEIEEQIRLHGKLRVLVQMHDFHGWTPGGLWEDIKFEMKHLQDFERIAFVGDQRWASVLSSFCKPLTPAEIRYFEPGQMEEARAWLQSA